MPDTFYRAFEERFRGSRELVKSRLSIYLPFIEPLRDLFPHPLVVDLGCGRGEWLEILGERGFEAQGVDVDDSMLAACRERGLAVHTRDACDFLKELPNDSQIVVSAFHVVEHIPFSDLETIVREALRVLKPGGFLIMETPNPENLVVGTSSFYLDPSHQRPIPPQLLAFLPEISGFKRTKIIRLQETKTFGPSSTAPTLLEVLTGVSPDYAVVAQKDAPQEVIEATSPAFSTEYGVTLETLANQYQQQVETSANTQEERALAAEARATEQESRAVIAEAKAQAHEQRASAAEARATEQESRAVIAEAKAQVFQSELNQTRQILHHANTQLEATTLQANAWHQQILDIQRSISWRVTILLRLVRKFMAALARGFCFLSKIILSGFALLLSLPFLPLLLLAIPFVMARPTLRNNIGQRIKQFPKLRYGLRFVAYRLHLIPDDPRKERIQQSQENLTSENVETSQYAPPNLEHLTPRAREIYYQLAAARDRNRNQRPPKTPDCPKEAIKFRGRMRCLEPIEAIWSTKQFRALAVEVTNDSVGLWHPTAENPIYLSYHWLSREGSVIVKEGLRSAINVSDLGPGQTKVGSLLIQAPEIKGRALLIGTLVQEGCGWFECHGFEPLRIELDMV